jgi:hexosaminidase
MKKGEIMKKGMKRILYMHGAVFLAAGIAQASAIGLVPMPKTMTINEGSLELGTRIVVATSDLRPLADVVAGEILQLTGNKMSIAEGGSASPGDVWLEITPARKGSSKKGVKEDQSYVLEVTDSARVSGGSYAAVASGTVTLLQLLEAKEATMTLPRCLIKDEPAAAYRGLLLDVARKPHSIKTIQNVIELCRWYKIRYLQLHLTDDQMFTFPSTAYPKLATPGHAYTLDELRGLEKYSKDRGVVIVPEFDVPGHAKAMVDAMPELFAVKGGARKGWSVTMNFAKEDVCLAVETIIEEMLDVFQSTPFFHVGADESNFIGFDNDPFFQEMYKKEGITSDLGKAREGRTVADHTKKLIKPEDHPRAYELFLRFIVRLNEKVKSCGRQALIWEGFSSAGITKVPTDMIVMPYHMRNHRPDWLVSDGYSLINTSSKDLYVVKGWAKPQLESIYKWDVHQFDWNDAAWKMPIVLPASAPVLGAQMCAWDQKESAELPTLRKRLATLSQRMWNPGFDKGFDEFSNRLDITDVKLSKLLGLKKPVTLTKLVTIGHWTPKLVSETYTPLIFDVTPLWKKSGKYDVKFQYTKGDHRLGIDSVELLANGVVVFTDRHRGETGGVHKANIYSIELKNYAPNKKYELRVSARSEGGTDSYGDVMFQQAASVDPTACSLWQLPGKRSQINSYVIKTTGNEIIVIDGGEKADAAYLRKFIQNLGGHVNAWFISHPHSDHVDALTEILKKPMGLKIDAIYGSLPDDEWLQKNPDSTSLKTQRALLAAVAAAKFKVLPLSLGQKIKFQGATFEILGVRNPEITVTTEPPGNLVNNQSAVWRVDIGDKSVLFLGDLGVEGGEKLLASSYRSRLKADYVQMAHHGQNGVNEEFYKTVNPTFCLWPTPGWLWSNDNGKGPWKTLEVRAWMDKLNVKKHYVAKDGLQRIDFPTQKSTVMNKL